MRSHRPPPAACHLILAACAVAAHACPAVAQQSVFSWGPAPSAPSTTWNPEAFSDYLLSGQPPHPAVVRIVAAERDGASLGSGVLVDADQSRGLVLTNWHVVRDTRSAVLVQFPDGFQTAGTVVRWDETWDLAAVVIWKPVVSPIPLAAAPPNLGDVLSIAGYGRGPYRAQTGRCIDYLSPAAGQPKEFVELSVGARQGDSGGPILNERGELAGVLFGQNEGRTIGACSTRLRTFLASLGSDGFTLADAANLLAQADDAPRTGRIHMVAATLPGPAQPQAPAGPWPHGGTSFAAPVVQSPLGSGPLPQAAPMWPFPLIPAVRLPTTAELAAVFDVTTHGQAMLSAAGGLALAVLGVRTLIGGRRRLHRTPPRPTVDD